MDKTFEYWKDNPREPSERERALIQELTMAIHWAKSPLSQAAAVIRDVIDKQVLNASPQEYLEAIRVAIQDERSLIPADERRHMRSDMQAYFQELERILSHRQETS